MSEQETTERAAVPTREQLEAETIGRLRQRCKEQHVNGRGAKALLVERLMLCYRGRADKYAGTLTKCRVCQAPVRVMSTQRHEQADGATIIVRYLRCSGSHSHRYQVSETVRPAGG